MVNLRASVSGEDRMTTLRTTLHIGEVRLGPDEREQFTITLKTVNAVSVYITTEIMFHIPNIHDHFEFFQFFQCFLCVCIMSCHVNILHQQSMLTLTH